MSANQPSFSGSSAVPVVDSFASYLRSASYMGEAAHGHCELVFARGVVFQNSAPSTRPFSRADSESVPSLPGRSIRRASQTAVSRRRGMGMSCRGFSLVTPFFRISIFANTPSFSGSSTIPVVVSFDSQLPSPSWERHGGVTMFAGRAGHGGMGMLFRGFSLKFIFFRLSIYQQTEILRFFRHPPSWLPLPPKYEVPPVACENQGEGAVSWCSRGGEVWRN